MTFLNPALIAQPKSIDLFRFVFFCDPPPPTTFWAHRQPDGVVGRIPWRPHGSGMMQQGHRGRVRRQWLSRGNGWLPQRSRTVYATKQPHLNTKSLELIRTKNRFACPIAPPVRQRSGCECARYCERVRLRLCSSL